MFRVDARQHSRLLLQVSDGMWQLPEVVTVHGGVLGEFGLVRHNPTGELPFTCGNGRLLLAWQCGYGLQGVEPIPCAVVDVSAVVWTHHSNILTPKTSSHVWSNPGQAENWKIS